MTFFNHVIEVDISANTYPEPILVKQGDSGRAIIIYPTSGGEPWPIPEGATAVVHILNPMHQSATYEAEITENEGRQCILFRISAEALLEAGRASMDATVTVNGVTVSTLNFMLDIEPAPASDFPIPTPGGGVTREELEAALAANSANDNQYTDYQVRNLRVDTGSQIAKVREEAGIRMAPVVSFVDDDGSAQIYTTLYPWMQEHQVPYCFAISTGTVDNTPKYATAAKLREMNQNKLVNWSCHMVGDDVMSDFTAAEYEARIIQWKAAMNGFGLPNTARTIMYNHGNAVQETLDTVVSKYFKAGFTVTKGINEPPYDALRMKRCGLFPTDEGFSLNDAKGKVLELLAAGTGWLVFFTHCYYESFNLEELTELVSFIRDFGIEIAGVEDVLTRYERFEEKGEDGHWETVEITTQSSRALGKATSATPGLPVNSNSASNCVTDPAVPLDGAKRVKVAGTAYSQESGSYGKYSFVTDDNTVIYCDYWPDVRAGDNATFELTVEVPNGATKLYVSGNSTRRMPAVSLRREGTAPGGGISREELEQALSEKSTADRTFAASAAVAAANQAMEEVKEYVDEQDNAFFQSLDASNRRIAALEAKPAGVSQADFETYKSQQSESITEIQQQIGYAEADLAALLDEVESVVSKF